MLIEGIEIKEEDLCILSAASLQGFGFTNANGIEVKHLPTGLNAVCTSERSQHANRDKALKELALLLKEQVAKAKPTFQEGQEVWVAFKDNPHKHKAVVLATGEHFTGLQDCFSLSKYIVENERVFALDYDKTKTIKIGEFDVPEPLREAPKEGTKVYIAYIYPYKEINWFYYTRGTLHEVYLQRGLLHLTAEAAVVHQEALLSFTTTELPSETNK